MCFHQTNRFVSFYYIESDLCELTQRAVTSRELFFYSASLLVFLWLPSSLSLFGFGICSLNEWSDPAERLKDMTQVWTEANIGATSKLPIPPQGDNSPRGATLAAPAVIPSLWLRVSTSAAPSDLCWPMEEIRPRRDLVLSVLLRWFICVLQFLLIAALKC